MGDLPRIFQLHLCKHLGMVKSDINNYMYDLNQFFFNFVFFIGSQLVELSINELFSSENGHIYKCLNFDPLHRYVHLEFKFG